ncbi:branched-chain amino acid ABC transporter permease [Microlunatus panaciterrae]|uniref:Branched-chain amino acid transport system permease protein n=1 Tax=Microlunatus panaciterrae TaxID=400768 RepID=A0ABS2RMM4_9ACTN|nr:branched-chain amino acid ABC transporter permease [Microlunatus panaciterrae]MBM7800222.1 branched-chain amino acid transport system permease protein [Microlunatus panaciterrae]
MIKIPTLSREQQLRSHTTGRLVGLVGAVVLIGSAYLPWAYGSAALDDMTFLGGPSPLQFCGLALGVLVLAALLVPRLIGVGRFRHRLGWVRAAKAASTGALVFLLLVLVSIALELGGLVNVMYGGWVALAGGAASFVGTRLMAADRAPTIAAAQAPQWLEILLIALTVGAAMLAAAFALNLSGGGAFVTFVTFVATVVAVLIRSGLMQWLSAASARHRKVLILAAFVVAFAFPFTQGGSDANMSIATQVLIFAGTAMGLNIVVGLAGLLDLGYIAFLGAGAFTSAILSESAFSTVGWHPPFIVVVLISACISATLGLIIGSPTLRVSGDYLAIVTLAFGEIFRISMNNLDGTDGPLLTRGSNGIPAVPDLVLFGYDFGQRHTVLGLELGRFSNYYFLLLVMVGLFILVFTRLNNSRIGRGWVAIREDEKAAEAMGVNVFGLKVFAFAGGAFLAGVAGSIKAHQDISVTPDQYIFLESAFLLAAIVLGGMGTVLGVLVGATLLKLMPEKLRFVNEYRLLIFGLLLVLMMRFRPEGLVASRRRALEFHEEDEELAERIEDELEVRAATKGTTR